MKVHLDYGKDGLEQEIPASNITILAPRFLPGLPDETAAFRDAARRPVESQPLKDVLRATDRVAVVIPDITRPLSTERVLLWMFSELSHIPATNLPVIHGPGPHRPHPHA